MEIYEPAEDSQILKRNLKDHVKGKTLEIGTGSGILAEEALKYADSVTAIDINPKAIEYCKKYIKNPKVTFIESDIFKNIPKEQFDTIICNPPYLPEDIGSDGKPLEDPALYGGKKGYEFIERLIAQVEQYLKTDGIILLLFSSYTKQKKVDAILHQFAYDFEEIDSMHVSFEDLFIYKITKSGQRKKAEQAGLTEITYLNHGKRGVIFTGKYTLISPHKNETKKKVTAAIKLKNPDSEAMNAIQNEAFWIQELNKYKIGPTYIKSGEDFVMYIYIDGIHLIDFVETAKKEQLIICFRDILMQCYILDTLKVNKLELNHPHKNIIITKENKPVLIDFERCKRTLEPKNVTQFCQYICSNPIREQYNRLNITIDIEKILKIIRKYKETYAKHIIDEIFILLKS
jgi:release factor glutamine methyltransferase